MRTILIGHPVVMIEFWPNEKGFLEPDTTTQDCRIYGICSELAPLGDNNSISAYPYGGDSSDALEFPLSLPKNAKPGTMVAFREEDATELYPVVEVVNKDRNMTLWQRVFRRGIFHRR